ncbi:DUF6245 family protein [Streptomyces sp. NPDC015127]|uniref:DUF6245 family protein n=1 Tax=Streptomyces sp. NPDC015127 TaxID=3364939 RepID=UPI0036FA58D7
MRRGGGAAQGSRGAGLGSGARLEFISWQVLRAGIPLRLMAQNQGAGPIPLAAAPR